MNKHQAVSQRSITPETIRGIAPEERAAMARQEILLTLKRFNCSVVPYRDLEKEKAEKSARSLALRLFSLFVKEFRQREIYAINIFGLEYPESDTKPAQEP